MRVLSLTILALLISANTASNASLGESRRGLQDGEDDTIAPTDLGGLTPGAPTPAPVGGFPTDSPIGTTPPGDDTPGFGDTPTFAPVDDTGFGDTPTFAPVDDSGIVGAPTFPPVDDSGIVGAPTFPPVDDSGIVGTPTTAPVDAGGVVISPTLPPVDGSPTPATVVAPTYAPVTPTNWPTRPVAQPTEPPMVPYEGTDDDPLQDDGEASQWNNETPEEMAHDQNVLIALAIVGGLGLCLAFCSAQQVIENPEGCCASICRLFVACLCGIVRCVCYPCRYICGCTGRDRRNHDLIMAGDNNYTHDLELS